MAGFDVQGVTRAGAGNNSCSGACLGDHAEPRRALSTGDCQERRSAQPRPRTWSCGRSQQAADLAFASDNGKLWLVLRPRTGAKPSTATMVTPETLLLGVNPVMVLHARVASR